MAKMITKIMFRKYGLTHGCKWLEGGVYFFRNKILFPSKCWISSRRIMFTIATSTALKLLNRAFSSSCNFMCEIFDPIGSLFLIDSSIFMTVLAISTGTSIPRSRPFLIALRVDTLNNRHASSTCSTSTLGDRESLASDSDKRMMASS